MIKQALCPYAIRIPVVLLINVLSVGTSLANPISSVDASPSVTPAVEPPDGKSSASSAQAGKTHLTPIQLFTLAQNAADHGNYALAESALRALASNPDADIRSEARFRLAMLLTYQEHKLRDAATLLRQILAEKPKAVRVRIELAEIQARLGNTLSAEVELRAAQAAGLPPEVERDVRFFMQALDTHRHLGASIEASLMPDTNANRATTATTIGTVLGALPLSPDAQRHSDLGANVRGQAYARLTLSSQVRLLAQLSGTATAFPDSEYDDFTVSPTVAYGKRNLCAGPNGDLFRYGHRIGQLWLGHLQFFRNHCTIERLGANDGHLPVHGYAGQHEQWFFRDGQPCGQSGHFQSGHSTHAECL
jgi:hypothetical protein